MSVTSREVQQARAIGVFARRLRFAGWERDGGAVRHETARRLLHVRLRVNRAGLLRHRNTRRRGGTP